MNILILKNALSKVKVSNLLLSVVAILIFIGGRATVSLPPKNQYCASYLKEIERLKKEVEYLKEKVALLQEQLSNCEQECASRVRFAIDQKDKNMKDELAKQITKLKDSFLQFKCENCKKLGRCK